MVNPKSPRRSPKLMLRTPLSTAPRKTPTYHFNIMNSNNSRLIVERTRRKAMNLKHSTAIVSILHFRSEGTC